MNSKLKRKIKVKGNSFLKQSSIHGALYLANDTNGFSRVTWLIVILCSVSLCAYMSRMTMMGYLENPTVTVVESTNFPIAKVPFPAVVVCPSNDFVYEPHTGNITDILIKRGYNSTMIDNFYDALVDFNIHRSTSSDITKMHDVLEDLGIPFTLLLKIFAKPCDVMLTKCYWRSMEHNCSNMFRHSLHHLGYCCRFDIYYFGNHSDPGTNLEAGQLKPEALKFIVNRDALTPNRNSERDVEIYILPPDRSMTIVDSSTVITPRTHLEIINDAWVIDTADKVKNLDMKTRKCMLDTDSHLEASFYTGCVSEGFHNDVVSRCRCRPFYYKSTSYSGFPNCTWDQYKCVFEELDKNRGKIAEIASRFNCYPDCDHVEYESEVDYASNNMDKAIERSQHTTEVTMHFNDNTCVKYRRKLLYTWEQLLASLGGLFGLCTGGSILSVIEVLYFLGDILVVVTVSWVRRQNLRRSKKSDILRTEGLKPKSYKNPKNNNVHILSVRPKFSYNE